MIVNVKSDGPEALKKLFQNRIQQWQGVGQMIAGVFNNMEYAHAVNYGGIVEYENPKRQSRKHGTYDFNPSGRKSVFEEGKTTVYIPGAHMIERSKPPVKNFFEQSMKKLGPMGPRKWTPHQVKGVVNSTVDVMHSTVSLLTPVDEGTLRRGWDKRYV